MSGAPTGERLGAGRLRVDADRALGKLRAYQLAESSAWILEAVRAAVASGATALRIEADANDLWLSWDGPAWPEAQLTGLFDALVSPHAVHDDAALRLLGAAINTALGGSVAYVDLVRVPTQGAAARVRYQPETLAGAALELETVDRPALVGGEGMLVHLRRSLGASVRGLFWSAAELAQVRAAAMDLAVPLVVEGRAIGREAHDHDLVRAPLPALPGGLRGFLALRAPGAPAADPEHAWIEVAEHGVVLARQRLAFAGVVDEPHRMPVPMPVRVFLDGPRQPTNVSRSQVRWDDPALARAVATAQGALRELVTAICARLDAAPDDDSLRGQACVLAFRRGEPGGPLQPIVERTLLRDAVGAPRSMATPWQRGYAHQGDQPLPAELAPWLDDVLWVRDGDPARALLASALDRGAMRRRHHEARRTHAAQAAFLAHAPSPPQVAATQPEIARGPLDRRVARSAAPALGLPGEVALFAEGESAAITLRLDQRPIEVVHVPSPLAFSAVVDSPHLRPRADYRAVVRDAAYDDAVRAAQLGAIALAETLDADAPPHLVRGAFRLLLELGLPPSLDSPLPAAAAWPALAGSAHSLRSLRSQPVIGVTSTKRGTPPRGRVILVLDDVDTAALRSLLGDQGRVVRYPPGSLAQPRGAQVIAERLQAAHGTALVLPDLDGAIAPLIDGRGLKVRVLHVDSLEQQDDVTSPLPAVLEVEYARAVPEPRPGDPPYRVPHADAVRALLVAIGDALAGAPPPALRGAPRSLLHPVARAWLAAIADARQAPPALLGEACVARLRAAKIVPVLGDDTLRSLDELPQGPLRYLPTDHGALPGVPIARLSATAARGLARLGDREARDATAELAAMRRERDRAARLARHREQGAAPLAFAGDTLQVQVPDTPGPMHLALGEAGLRLEVLLDGRPLTQIDNPQLPPLRARVDVVDGAVDEEVTTVTSTVLARLMAAALEGAGALVVAHVRQRPACLVDDERIRAVLLSHLARTANREIRRELAEVPCWPTVQGGVASVAELASHGLRGAEAGVAWLPALAGEPATALDLPICALAPGEAGRLQRQILRSLAGTGAEVRNVDAALVELHSRRLIARGDAPRPQVPVIARAHAMPLEELGGALRPLGPGEAALRTDGGPSSVVAHAGGRVRTTIHLNAQPAVWLAVEAPTAGGASEAWERAARAAAIALVRAWCARPTRPPEIARAIADAWLHDQLEDAWLGDAAVFEDTTGTWHAHHALSTQIHLLGDLWCVAATETRRPLRDERLAIRSAPLRGDVREGCRDGTAELALDEEARTRQAAPRVHDHTPPVDRTGLLGEPIVVDGDGQTAPRGWLALRAPGAAGGVRVYREGLPLRELYDGDAWPMTGALELASLTPDRTWRAPVEDAAFDQLIAAADAARDRAADALGAPPDDAVTKTRIRTGRDPRTRAIGSLWVPRQGADQIAVITRDGRRLVEDTHGCAGWLACNDPALAERTLRGWQRALLDVHTPAARDGDAAAVALLGRALLDGVATPKMLRGVTFVGLAEPPPDAQGLLLLAAGGPGFIDDGSPLAAKVRGMRPASAPKAPTPVRAAGRREDAEAAAPPRASTTPTHAAGAARANDDTDVSAKRRAHVQHLLRERLEALGVGPGRARWVSIVDDDALGAWRNDAFRLGARHPLLAKVFAAYDDDAPYTARMVDALAVWAQGALNRALTEVTDAEQREALRHRLRAATPP